MGEAVKDARELPRALMPWAEYLQLLPAEQIVAFAPVVQRLDVAIGPMRVQTRGGGGEPDGYDGISRRGAYDRLLLSEWLLADEMPDEFARRAVMSEHAFLQIARQDPAGARISFALFDAGPNQLGAPRIAHLAALIVLARRAEAAGAALVWGVLQRPNDPERVGVSASGFSYLFASRGSIEATEEHLAAWRDAAPIRIGSEEFWIIGGDRVSRLTGAAGASFLILDDPLVSGERHLAAEIRHAGRPATQITLELPDDSTCVRLLREPGHEIAARFVRLPTLGSPPTSNLLFFPGGVKMAGRLCHNQLVSYPVPNSPYAGVGKSRSIIARSRESIVAIGRFGRDYAVVTTTPEPRRMEFTRLHDIHANATPFRLPESMRVPEIRDDTVISPLFQVHEVTGDGFWLLVVDNALLRFNGSGGPEEATVLCAPLEAVALWPGGEVASIGFSSGKWRLEARSATGVTLYRTFDSVSRAFFGAAGHFKRRSLAAVQQEDSAWRLCNLSASDRGANDDRVVTPPGGEVVGVYGLRPDVVQDIGLILLADDRRTVRFWFPDTSGDILTADSNILQIVVNPYLANGIVVTNIAYLTESGQLTVYSLNYNRNLLHLQFTDALMEARVDLTSTLWGIGAGQRPV